MAFILASANSDTSRPRNARVSICCAVLFTTSGTPISTTPGAFCGLAAGVASSCASFTSFASLTARVSDTKSPAWLIPAGMSNNAASRFVISSSVISMETDVDLPSSPAIVVA